MSISEFLTFDYTYLTEEELNNKETSIAKIYTFFDYDTIEYFLSADYEN